MFIDQVLEGIETGIINYYKWVIQNPDSALIGFLFGILFGLHIFQPQYYIRPILKDYAYISALIADNGTQV